jgi:hypothetical protein
MENITATSQSRTGAYTLRTHFKTCSQRYTRYLLMWSPPPGPRVYIGHAIAPDREAQKTQIGLSNDPWDVLKQMIQRE